MSKAEPDTMAGILRPPLFPWHASRGHGRTEDFPLKKKEKKGLRLI